MSSAPPIPASSHIAGVLRSTPSLEALPTAGTSAAQGSIVSDRRPNLRTLHDDESGAAFVEYVVVLLLIGTVASVATYSLGRPFVDYYRFAQLIVSMPFP